jgi:hypothetical protein
VLDLVGYIASAGQNNQIVFGALLELLDVSARRFECTFIRSPMASPQARESSRTGTRAGAIDHRALHRRDASR